MHDRKKRFTDFGIEQVAPCRRFALLVPATLEVLDSWYLLWAIDLYMCNICAIYYDLLLLYRQQTERNE